MLQLCIPCAYRVQQTKPLVNWCIYATRNYPTTFFKVQCIAASGWELLVVLKPDRVSALQQVETVCSLLASLLRLWQAQVDIENQACQLHPVGESLT